MNVDGNFTDEQLLLTTAQAAKVLGIGRTGIYELIKSRELRPVHIARSCRISWAELERYVRRLEGQVVDDVAVGERRWRRVVDDDGSHRVFPGYVVDDASA